MSRQDLAMAPLTVGVKGLAQLLGVSRSHIYRLDSTGEMPQGLRLGNRRVWLVEEVHAWLRAGSPRRDLWELLKEGS